MREAAMRLAALRMAAIRMAAIWRRPKRPPAKGMTL